MSRIEISDDNPNEMVGGGGCLGNGDAKHEDCEGPYVIFYQSATDSNISPHAVLCKNCLNEAYNKLIDKAMVESPLTPDSWKGDEPILDLPASEVTEIPDV